MPTTRWVTGRAGSGWWRRLHNGSEEQLDDNHLMRMAGRFARRVKAWGAASGIPVIYCKSGERKHRIAEEYLATHDIVKPGVFLVLAAKAPATIWQVRRSANGVIGNLATKYSYVNHYSFHIMDPQWGHVTDQDVRAPAVRRAGHAQRPRVRGLSGAGRRDRFPQGRQLFHRGRRPERPGSGRRYLVAARDYRAPEPGLQPVDLHRVPVFRPGHRRGAAQRVRIRLLRYQVEYSRNLLFADGLRMQRLFDTVVDRTRSRLNVTRLWTMFGAKQRPHHDRTTTAPGDHPGSQPWSRHLCTT